MSKPTTPAAVSPADRQLRATVRGKNYCLAYRACELLEAEQPMTLRQLYYRLVSCGELPNNQQAYKRLGSLMTRLRESGDIPRTWIVDHVRMSLKPSSWSGLSDYADSVRECYRRDFWSSLRSHVEIFVEKDAVAGTIQPVTHEYDIALRVCRGYSSVSFAGEIADLWSQIEKPIFAYYLGDFDPSGFDIERDLRDKLTDYTGTTVWTYEPLGQEPLYVRNDPPQRYQFWVRLGVTANDFEDFDLIPLPVKNSDTRAAKFLREHRQCAEVDALPPSELRRRVRQAIEQHVDAEEWHRLQAVESAEQETLNRMLLKLGRKA